VLDALATSYRHIDTSTQYGNLAAIGRAVAKSGVPRASVWITVKLYG
jgi:2,5-diketo-D-gluconate reductase A